MTTTTPPPAAPGTRSILLPLALGLLVFAVAFGLQAMFRGSCERFGFQFGVMLFAAVLSVGALGLALAAALLLTPMRHAPAPPLLARAGGAALAMIALGILAAETHFVLDESRFRREATAAAAAAPDTTYWRPRAWPGHMSTLHYSVERGYWAVD